MTVNEIKSAVLAGRTVHWVTNAYRVILDSVGEWLVICEDNGHCIGLTWRDGITLNGQSEQFYTI